MSAPRDGGDGRIDVGTAGGEAGASIRDVDRWMYEFVARLAHDMRTPLGAILMWGHVLRAGHEEDRVAAISAIEASARAQSKMIADLVDISRAVMGRLPIDRADVDVVALARSTAQALAPGAVERDVEIDVAVAAPAGHGLRPVRGDAMRLGQVVANLVTRAIKVTPAGKRVTIIVASPSEAGVELAVHDQGPRLNDAERGDLFTPYRATMDPDGGPPSDGAIGAAGSVAGGMGLGMGLGLAFARCLVDLHGGTIRADGRGGEPGTTITVRLPFDPPAPAPRTG